MDDHPGAHQVEDNQQLDIMKTEEAHPEKKSHASVRKLAPPKGWKAPPQKTNIDLLDLLDAEIPMSHPAAESKEETKQNTPTPQNNETPKNYLDDLLSLDIGGGSHHQTQPQNQNVSNNANGGFNFGNAQPVNPNLNFMGSMSPSLQVNNNQMGMNQFASAPGFQNFNSFNQPNPNNFTSGPDLFGNNNHVNQNTGNQGGFDFNFGQAPSNQNAQPQVQER